MVSERKAIANSANALKSTGPKTVDGLARSASNATRHGLYTASVVVPAAGESAEQFD